MHPIKVIYVWIPSINSKHAWTYHHSMIQGAVVFFTASTGKTPLDGGPQTRSRWSIPRGQTMRKSFQACLISCSSRHQLVRSPLDDTPTTLTMDPERTWTCKTSVFPTSWIFLFIQIYRAQVAIIVFHPEVLRKTIVFYDIYGRGDH